MAYQPLPELFDAELEPHQGVSLALCKLGELLSLSALSINAERLSQFLDLSLVLPGLLRQGCGMCSGPLFEMKVVLALLCRQTFNSLSLRPHCLPSHLRLVAPLCSLCLL
jgi:hypothetical protein